MTIVNPTYIQAGCCVACDEPCFEVLAVWGEGERYPGEPKRLGRAIEGAIRISYLLLDGKRLEPTFCAICAGAVDLANDGEAIWRKVQRGWQRECSVTYPGKEMPEWYGRSFDNGILSEMGRVSWRELTNG